MLKYCLNLIITWNTNLYKPVDRTNLGCAIKSIQINNLYIHVEESAEMEHCLSSLIVICVLGLVTGYITDVINQAWGCYRKS